jgi:hypothetical protein
MFPNSETTKQFLTDHFRKRRTPLTEDAILDAITAPRSKYDVYWGVLALRDFGTARSIPALKGLLHYPMQDVKDCSLLTIAHSQARQEAPFYLEALADKGGRRCRPMWAIEVAADERGCARQSSGGKRAALRKPLDRTSGPGDAYISGLKYSHA